MSLVCINDAEWQVSVSTDLTHNYHFLDNVFASDSKTLATIYGPWKRCLAIVDSSVYKTYLESIEAYFAANEILLTAQSVYITEDQKSVETLLKICELITEFGLTRREPVLVLGGGLVTDVVGFACAIYRRSTPYIRIPTTLIGLIDASISNRVAVNWNGLKNRLGAYHEPLHTIIDATFLKTLPGSEIRNGLAEILKISSCTDVALFELVERFGKDLIEKKFGLAEQRESGLKTIADDIIRQAIRRVLDVEVPNSREHNLDRVMFFGHTWSPVLELVADPPLMHGHAISVDMCFSATLAHVLGRLSMSCYTRFLNTFSEIGLALDHSDFTLGLMEEATASTTATRAGRLRAPVPIESLGKHEILQQVSREELEEAWRLHKEKVKTYPRYGLGLQVAIDSRLPDTNAGIAPPIANGEAEKTIGPKSLRN